MEHSLYPVNPYKSLPAAAVRQWPEDGDMPEIPPGPFAASLFWLLLDETMVAQCSRTYSHTLVKA